MLDVLFLDHEDLGQPRLVTKKYDLLGQSVAKF